MKLVEALPEFSEQIAAALQADDRPDLARQVYAAEIDRYTFDSSCNAAYIYLRPGRPLNVVEANIIGVKHGETISLEHRYWVNIDTDNFNRLAGIELLNGKDVADKLSKTSDL